MLQLIVLIVLLERICFINYTHYHVQGAHKRTTPAPTTTMPRPRGRYYSPNWGYEPYWPGGHWVQNTNPDLSTTTKPPMVCGRECNYLYRDIQKVCGRHDWNTKYIGCDPYYHWCTGYPPDYYEEGYKTFNTYCEFLDAECSGHRVSPMYNRWTFVHMGECEKNQNLTFKPMFTDEPIKRMKVYLSSLSERFNKLQRTPCEDAKTTMFTWPTKQ